MEKRGVLRRAGEAAADGVGAVLLNDHESSIRGQPGARDNLQLASERDRVGVPAQNHEAIVFGARRRAVDFQFQGPGAGELVVSINGRHSGRIRPRVDRDIIADDARPAQRAAHHRHGAQRRAGQIQSPGRDGRRAGEAIGPGQR